jgi:hypothetical protein
VADTFDAITSKRSYRQPRPHKAALDIMRGEAGAQLDPDAVRAFRSAYFGRRWLWIPASAINAAGRLLAGAAAHVADTAAVAAGAAAIGAAPLLAPMTSGPTSTPHTPSRLASNVSGEISLPARNVSGVRRISTAVRPAHSGRIPHGQTHRISLTSLPRGRHNPVPTAPRGADAPIGSGPSTPGSSGSAGSSGGGTGAIPSPRPGGGSGGGQTVTAAGTTVTAGPQGSTATTTVPGTTTTVSATASSGTISASANAGGLSVGVTVKTGLPGLSLPAPPSLPGLPSLPRPLG